MHHSFRSRGGFDFDALPSSRSGQSLLSEGIFDSNIDTSTPGHIRVALWHEWRAMLSDLTDLGPVWSIVRNGQCTLAAHGDYPKLTFAPDQQSAIASQGDYSLVCHFRAWRQAAAVDSGCHCGRIYGVEIENGLGQVFHRICLARGTALDPFIEWTQMHQATGLEEDEDTVPLDQGRFHPQSFRLSPGTLEVSPHRLRTVLIHAAQREIPLLADVASEGITQTARIDVLRASEAQGQLVLSGDHCSLYVTSESTGSLFAESANLEGETMWRLSLVDPDGRRLMHLQSGVDGRDDWNKLIREFVLCSSTTER